MKYFPGYITMLFLTLCSLPCVAQQIMNGISSTDSRVYRDSLYRHISDDRRISHSCHFSYDQGSSAIRVDLASNAFELSRLDSFIRYGVNHPELYVSRVRLTGYCSIEGSYYTNEQLARSRAESFYHYLRKRYPVLTNFPNDVAWVAEDWKGLSKLVRSSGLNEWEEVLEIIRKVPGFDERERLIAYLNGGRAYNYIERMILPRLRRVEMEIEYSLVPYTNTNLEATLKEMVEEIEDPSYQLKVEEEVKEPQPEPATEDYTHKSIEAVVKSEALHTGNQLQQCEDFRFALKTNALLWAGVQHNFKHTTSVANVALEYYITDRWSIEVGAMYSYWRFNSNQEFQGISGYRLEPRFSYPVVRDKFDVYLGLYGRVGDYDRRLIDSSQLPIDYSTNYTGDYWDAGLSAGVTLRLVGALGLEVGARAGYVHTNAIRYTKDGEYNWYHSRKGYNKFKVTDLNVSLIYRFR